jgi:glycosyltransferase involved in cell wall biosynthesis
MRVSVIIPTHFRASMLCEAIDSVIAQNVDDLEVVVVDDGSTDDTSERVCAYGDPVRYLHQENQGLSTARNLGLSVAKGEYVALLDDDDWWMPGKLELQVQILDKLRELAGVFTNFSIYRSESDITKNGIQTWYESPMDWNEVFGHSMDAGDILDNFSLATPETKLHIGSLYEQSLDNYFVLPSTALFRRSLVPEHLRFPPHDPICGDWDFFARLSVDAPLCFVDCDTTYNRSHNDEFRLTRTHAIRQMELRIDFLERVYRSDEDFYAAHKQEVDRVWKERLIRLSFLHLLDSDWKSARAATSRFRAIGGPINMRQRLVIAACATPGAGQLMRAAREIRRRLQ